MIMPDVPRVVSATVQDSESRMGALFDSWPAFITMIAFNCVNAPHERACSVSPALIDMNPGW